MGNGLTVRLVPLCQNRAHYTLQICSTLPEWEHIADRFENATHYSEKALHKLLKNRIVPVVVAGLQVGTYTGVCFLMLNRCLGT